MRTFFGVDLHEIVPRIRCPTLVLHPRSDMIIPFDEGRAVAALIPGARFVPLDTRNFILLEQDPEWARFVAELDNFLPAPPRKPDVLFNELSAREHQVLELVAQGLGNSMIAARLSITEKTVRNHVSTVFDKLGVNSRAQAIVYARDAGFGKKNSG